MGSGRERYLHRSSNGLATQTPHTNLRERIRKLARYGAGHKIGHEGGRAMWQLPPDSLLVAWRRSESADEAVSEEARLIEAYARAVDVRTELQRAWQLARDSLRWPLGGVCGADFLL